MMYSNQVMEKTTSMKKVYYLGYYGDPSPLSNRDNTPAADTKMSYVIESMKKSGCEVEVISFCADEDRKVMFRKKAGYEIIRNNTKVMFFDNYTSKYRILRVAGRWISWIKIKHYLKEHCLSQDSKIVIYHSIGLLKVLRFFHRKRKPFILEMEEIYADVIGKKQLHTREIQAAKLASGYIFPTQMMSKEINPNKKPEIVIHGTYHVEPDRKYNLLGINSNHDKSDIIHVVYAGTLDARKGGATVAVASAEFLSQRYHVHILGFGSKSEKQFIQDQITDIVSRTKAKVSYDGLLSGEEYIRFIQNCDIGLSTQNPDAAFNATSFPSKILSYLSNGLHVVSVRIPVVEYSAIGDILTYYDNQTPEEVAKAIKNVRMDLPYDSRMRIQALDREICEQLKSFLG